MIETGLPLRGLECLEEKINQSVKCGKNLCAHFVNAEGLPLRSRSLSPYGIPN